MSRVGLDHGSTPPEADNYALVKEHSYWWKSRCQWSTEPKRMSNQPSPKVTKPLADERVQKLAAQCQIWALISQASCCMSCILLLNHIFIPLPMKMQVSYLNQFYFISVSNCIWFTRNMKVASIVVGEPQLRRALRKPLTICRFKQTRVKWVRWFPITKLTSSVLTAILSVIALLSLFLKRSFAKIHHGVAIGRFEPQTLTCQYSRLSHDGNWLVALISFTLCFFSNFIRFFFSSLIWIIIVIWKQRRQMHTETGQKWEKRLALSHLPA